MSEIVAEIDSLIQKEESPEYRESLERWRIHYQDRARTIKRRLSLPHAASRYAAGKDRDLLPKLMNHARRHLAKMRRDGVISEEARRRIEYDFDMEEQRLQRYLSRIARD